MIHDQMTLFAAPVAQTESPAPRHKPARKAARARPSAADEAVTAPLALLALLLPAGPTALLGLWVAFTVGFMGARAVTLGLPARGPGAP